MLLFDKFSSRKLQFAADVLAVLTPQDARLSAQALSPLAARYGMDPLLAAQTLRVLVDADILLYDAGRKYSINRDWPWAIPPLPLSSTEEAYLQMILRLPQAKLFLREETAAKLSAETEAFDDTVIDRLTPQTAQLPEIARKDFTVLLNALARGHGIRYLFRSRGQQIAVEAAAVPWRLEYSPFDGRWWAILYVPEEDRCVKAWLENLSDLCPAADVTATEQQIMASRSRNLVPEPLTLKIRNFNRALERCFLAFEGQEVVQSRLQDDGTCIVSFRYYHYEESDLLRRFLYLGGNVTLLAPENLRKKLLSRIDEALANFDI